MKKGFTLNSRISHWNRIMKDKHLCFKVQAQAGNLTPRGHLLFTPPMNLQWVFKFSSSYAYPLAKYQTFWQQKWLEPQVPLQILSRKRGRLVPYVGHKRFLSALFARLGIVLKHAKEVIGQSINLFADLHRTFFFFLERCSSG